MFVPFHVSLPASLLDAANRLFDAPPPPPASMHFCFSEIEQGGGMDWMKVAANKFPLPVRLEFENWIVTQPKYRLWAGVYAIYLCQYGYETERERGERMLIALGKTPPPAPRGELVDLLSTGEHDVIATPAVSVEFGLVSEDKAIVIMESIEGQKHFVICPKGILVEALENLTNETL